MRSVQYFDRTDGGASLAYQLVPGTPPTVVFLCGYRSDMSGKKATSVRRWAARRGAAALSFDWSGHGLSHGDFEQCTVSTWIKDALCLIDALTSGPLVLVGASMGGWIMLHLALARPQRVSGLIGLGSAPDFPDQMLERRFSDAQTRALESEGIVHLPSRYDDGPYPVTKALLDDGQKLRLLDRPIHITCPVRLFHAMADPDVSWERSVAVAKALVGNDVRLELSKVGDHRLSSEEDLRRLDACLGEMADRLLQLP